MKSSSKYRRSYNIKVCPATNKGKIAQLDAMQEEWVKLMRVVGELLLSELKAGLREKPLQMRNASILAIKESPLQNSIKQCACVSAEGLMSSWKSNLANRLSRLIMRSNKYSDEFKHELNYLNRNKLWMVPYEEQCEIVYLAIKENKTTLKTISPSASELLRRYALKYLQHFETPTFENMPMQVNQLSAELSIANSASLFNVNNWLRISSLTKGSRINLPLSKNSYADRFEGEVDKTYTLRKIDNEWYVKITKRFNKAAELESGAEIALDLGMTNSIAVSTGSIYLREFSRHLKKWDAAFIKLQAGLQKAGIPPNSAKRYKAFIRKFRSYITSELNRIVKKLISLNTPKTVVIETLTYFKEAGNKSATLNRLFRKIGYGVIKKKLSELSEVKGFTLHEVNAAYTSQLCGNCGFIHSSNRNGNIFRCVSCGNTIHADVNAARNLLERFKQGVANPRHYSALRLAGLKSWAKKSLKQLKRLPANRLEYSTLGSAREGLQVLSSEIKEPNNRLLEINELINLATLLNCIKRKNFYSVYLNIVPTSECN